MPTQQPTQNPQEIFQAFAKEIARFYEGFAANQGQEMLQEFMQAWEAWYQQSLQNPQQWLDLVTRYQQDQLKLWMSMLGTKPSEPATPVVTPPPGDRRFVAKEWQENPVFNYVRQSYLLTSNLLNDMAKVTPLEESNKKKLLFYTKYFVDAISPSNFAMTNPEVMRLAMETKGQSLMDGLKNLLTDLEKGRISMTDETAFQLGKNLAVTAGAVVYENDLMQLLQYQPTTEKVLDRPLVIVPPCINKFYILDLSPENSFIKYAVDQGNTVFVISWVNPGLELRDYSWDDYLELGVFTAFKVIKEITGAEQINAGSWCIGGTILASALAVMHQKNDLSVASATYFTTMLDFSEPGDLGVFIDEVQIARRESQVKFKGLLSGKDLALTFSMLRANDLIWSYVVSNYLKGQTPPPFDILYWNSDSTNLPANMYSYYIRNLYLDNKLIQPNALTMCEVPVDLRNIKTPSYFLSTLEDHIAPWKTTFNSTELFSGPIEFVLGASGHIAGVINPPAKKKRNYWIGGELGKGPDHWQKTAKSTAGSWWPYWSAWLQKQGGTEIPAPKELGNTKYRVIEAAPGRYVTKRLN
jgi:polyhydroxyalkanoate synthase